MDEEDNVDPIPVDDNIIPTAPPFVFTNAVVSFTHFRFDCSL